MAEVAYQQELKQVKEIRAKTAEAKSTEAMKSEILKAGKKDKNSAIGKKSNSNKTTVKFGEQFERNNRKKALKPNIRYETPDGYIYETDDLGRIVSVQGVLELEDGKRNSYVQSHVGKGDGRKDTDDGEHLIATIFNGSGNIDNLVPIDSNLNRGNWKTMENEWSEALKKEPPQNVEVNIKPIYGDDSQRPIRFEVKYRIGNEVWDRKFFKNENQRRFEHG